MGRKTNSDYLKLTEDDTLRLILLYQSEVCLYDPHFAGYKNREVRRGAIERIAATLAIDGIGPSEIQYKLKNLRNCYAKEMKKIEKSANSGMRLDQLYVPKVFWFPLLDQFLRPHMQPKTSSKSNSLQDDLETSKVIEIEDDDSSEEEDAVETDYELDEDTATSSTVYQESKERELPSPYGEPQAKRSKPAPSRTLDNETNRFQSSREQTEFDVWAQSVAMQLNGMELRRALNLQLQIQTLISNERLSYEEFKSANNPSTAAAFQAGSRKRQQVRLEGHNGTPGQTGYFPMNPWDQVAPYMFMNDQMVRGRGKHSKPQSDSTGENNVDIMSPFSQHSSIQPATTKR